MDEGQELENSTRLAHLEVEAGGCPVVFRQHVRRFADGLVAVPYHYLLYYLFHLRSVFASHPAWYWHSTLSVFLGHSRLRHVARGENAAYRRGGIPQTRGVINGRITYRHPFIEMVSSS